jgi:hypothetical protein
MVNRCSTTALSAGKEWTQATEKGQPLLRYPTARICSNPRSILATLL